MNELQRELMEFEREIRDPIYNYIPITELECYVIDTPVFQRLDRIRQMHAGYKVYPSARYSRKVHSLGAMHLSGKAALRLLYLQDDDFADLISSPIIAGKNSRKDSREVLDDLGFLRIFPELYRADIEINLNDFVLDDYAEWGGEEDEVHDRTREIIDSAAWVVQAIRLIGLLHDIGHGPFSHMLENVEGVDFDHNEVAPTLIDHLTEEVKANLEEDGRESVEFGEDILNFVKDILATGESLDEDLRFLYEITDFPFDIDMLDYLVRDSYFAGTPEYGQIDAERIIRGFAVKNGTLRISRSAMTAVNDAFDSYFEMYKAVYTHKTVVMYEILLDEAFQAFHEFEDGIGFIDGQGGGDLPIDVEAFIEFDDQKLISELEAKNEEYRGENGDDAEFWELFSAFRNREKPYKQLCEYPLNIDVKVYNRAKQEEAEEGIEEKLDTLIEDSAGPVINLPHRSINRIRRAGISLDDLKNWATQKTIYDPKYDDVDDAFLSFSDVNPEIERRLNTIEINIRIFIERDEPVDEQELRQRIHQELSQYETELRDSLEKEENIEHTE